MNPFQVTIDKFNEVMSSELGQFIAPALPAILVMISVVILGYVVFISSFSFLDFMSAVFRPIGRVLAALGLKKRKRYWGIVYDSVTKQALDPAFVQLRNSVGKVVGQAITDLDGRYGFVDQTPGVYTMTVNRTNYIFPSEKLMNQTEDGSYRDLYFGEQMLLTKNQNSILKNIPLDPTGTDWNESQKRENHMLHSYTRHTVLVRFFANWFFVFGVIVSVIAWFYMPAPYTYILYGLLFIINFILANNVSAMPYGTVIEKSSGLPLGFARIQIFYDMPSPQPIKYATKICDRDGKYYCLAPKNRYYITIEKKNPDQTYKKIFTSSPFTVSNGVINTTFEV